MDWIRENKFSVIQEFIENALFHRNIEKINQFFYEILNEIQSKEQELAEISRLYKKLAFVNDSESLIESLLELLNYLSFLHVDYIGKKLGNEDCMEAVENLRNMGGENHEILINVKNLTSIKSLKIVQRLKNSESLRFDESGNCSHDCRKVAFFNKNGLVFVNSHSNIRVEISSLDLEQGYEIDLANGFKMIVKDLNRNFCTLEVVSMESIRRISEKKIFDRSCKDLSKEFTTCQVNVLKLKKRTNKWVMKKSILNNLENIFLMLKNNENSENENYHFIPSGSQIFLSRSLYRVTYSYV